MLTLHLQVEKNTFTSQKCEFIMLLWNTPPWTFIIKTKSQFKNMHNYFMKDPTEASLRLKQKQKQKVKLSSIFSTNKVFFISNV